MDKNYKNKLKNKSGLLIEYKRLVSESGVLDPLLLEIKGLKRGEVNPKSTIRRSAIASPFTSAIQQIFNYAYNHNIVFDEEMNDGLGNIISKADAVLRENIVLQSKPPLDVIKFKNVPVRYSHSSSGSREQRWGCGLHKLPTTEQGYSICIAIMPPRYTQSYHNHTISEYTLALDKKIISIANPGEKEKRDTANANEIIHFSSTTPHTLYNPANSFSRNITVKIPTGLMDWKPIYDLHQIKTTHSEVLKGRLSELDTRTLISSKLKGGSKIFFSIRDKYYNYDLELLELKKDSVMEDVYSKDRYFFVIEGDFLISSGDIKKQCSQNDYIVIDRNTNFEIKTKTKTRLYTVDI